MSEPKRYKSKASYRKAEAWRHIHGTKHGPDPPAWIEIDGKRHKVTGIKTPPSNTGLDILALGIGVGSLLLGLYALGWFAPIYSAIRGVVP